MPDIYLDVDAALSEVPVNIFPLTDDTDFKTRETAVAYNASGMDLVWNFVTSAGAFTQTAVTPTTAGDYDWTHQGDGMYTIEIPASGGASINNDTEGYGWFTGVATGVLPWRGPILGFRAAAINDSLCDTNTTGLLAPTTAGRTLDVTAGGEAGIDWANIGSPTTTVNLSGTSTLALEPTTAGRKLDVTTTGEAGLDFTNVLLADGAIPALGWSESGTLQSATASTAVLRAATSIADDLILGSTIYIRSGTGAGQSRYIYDWVSSTDTASVSPDWTTTPDNTSVYAILATAPGPTHSSTVPSVNVIQISGDSVAADNCEAFFDGTGYAGTNNVIPTVTTLTGHTAQTGDAFARLGAPIGASISADIQTVDTVVDAVKAKTDSLTFTQAGHVDANVQRINDVTITGDGSSGDKFDVV